MPWKRTEPVQERMQFVVEALGGAFTMTELCERYGVSRKTGYKWLARFREEGYGGLTDRSRRPGRSPQQTRPELAERILGVRQRRPRWGARKILDRLRLDDPEIVLPAASTAHEILRRAGLVRPRRRGRGRGMEVLVTGPRRATRPNEWWTTDHKGQFRVGNGQLCYPLTIADGFSRYLLACAAQHSTRTREARGVFERVFRNYGLPEGVLSDNGPPFGARALCGLSRLSVWWLKLGIRVVRIARGHPEQNGAHERMHRELQAEAAAPPGRTWRAQQRRLAAFRRDYNQERPHAALAGRTPQSLYSPSPRPFTRETPGLDYPMEFARRQVRANGEIKWRGRGVFLSEVLKGEPVGLQEIDEGLWTIYFCALELGRFNEKTGRFYAGAPKATAPPVRRTLEPMNSLETEDEAGGASSAASSTLEEVLPMSSD